MYLDNGEAVLNNMRGNRQAQRDILVEERNLGIMTDIVFVGEGAMVRHKISR